MTTRQSSALCGKHFTIESGFDVNYHWQSGSYCPTRELRRLLSRARSRVPRLTESRSDSGCAHFQCRSSRAKNSCGQCGTRNRAYPAIMARDGSSHRYLSHPRVKAIVFVPISDEAFVSCQRGACGTRPAMAGVDDSFASPPRWTARRIVALPSFADSLSSVSPRRSPRARAASSRPSWRARRAARAGPRPRRRAGRGRPCHTVHPARHGGASTWHASTASGSSGRSWRAPEHPEPGGSRWPPEDDLRTARQSRARQYFPRSSGPWRRDVLRFSDIADKPPKS